MVTDYLIDMIECFGGVVPELRKPRSPLVTRIGVAIVRTLLHRRACIVSRRFGGRERPYDAWLIRMLERTYNPIEMWLHAPMFYNVRALNAELKRLFDE